MFSRMFKSEIIPALTRTDRTCLTLKAGLRFTAILRVSVLASRKIYPSAKE